MAMGEINHDFWDELFESQTYENIDQDTLLHLIKEVKDMKKDLSVIQQEFEEIYNINFQTGINQEKPEEAMSKEVQRNTACTSTATQNTENDAKSKENIKFLEQLQEEITEKLEKVDLTKQRMTDSMPNEIDDKKGELMRNDKHLQFIEIMHQDEIRKVSDQIVQNHDRICSIIDTVKIYTQMEYFMHQINLTSKFLEFEDEVLKLKLERERMTTEGKTVGVEQSVVMSCKIVHEKSKLMIDNKYLWFVETMRQKEINRIFVQLQMFCDNYNIPNEEVKIATHRDFIMQRIEKLKKILKQKKKVIDFNLQIEREATNMETKDTVTSNVSRKNNNVKSTLMKNNKYLRYIAMKHQEEINRVYTELQVFCDKYHLAIENVKLAMHPSVGADVEKINMPSEIDERNELRKNIEYLRSVKAIYQKEFIRIHDQLEIHSNRYDLPSKNVTIVMHTKPYIPLTTHDEENELKRDNEYLAFVAMMHLEKIKEICAFFVMCNDQRCNVTIEELTKTNFFMKQKVYVTNEISNLKDLISELWDEWGWIQTSEQYVKNNTR